MNRKLRMLRAWLWWLWRPAFVDPNGRLYRFTPRHAWTMAKHEVQP